MKTNKTNNEVKLSTPAKPEVIETPAKPEAIDKALIYVGRPDNDNWNELGKSLFHSVGRFPFRRQDQITIAKAGNYKPAIGRYVFDANSLLIGKYGFGVTSKRIEGPVTLGHFSELKLTFLACKVNGIDGLAVFTNRGIYGAFTSDKGKSWTSCQINQDNGSVIGWAGKHFHQAGPDSSYVKDYSPCKAIALPSYK